MITDIQKSKDGMEGMVHWELFDEELEVLISEGASLAYAEQCARVMNALSLDTVQAIFEAAKRYCLAFMDLVGEDGGDLFDDMGIEVTPDTPAELLKSEIIPSALIVDEPRDQRVGFHVECNCSWEPEHGLELTILDGKLVYLGAFGDHSAWQNFSPEDNWNYVN